MGTVITIGAAVHQTEIQAAVRDSRIAGRVFAKSELADVIARRRHEKSAWKKLHSLIAFERNVIYAELKLIRLRDISGIKERRTRVIKAPAYH